MTFHGLDKLDFHWIFESPRLLLPEFWERPTAVAAVAAANRAMKGLLCAGDGQLHISCLTCKTRRVTTSPSKVTDLPWPLQI